MQYPIFNIGIKEWGKNPELIQEMYWHNDIYYSKDEIFFSKYCLNRDFVDCEGEVYRLVRERTLKKVVVSPAFHTSV